ncbi:fasciclin domain-containing protein [Arcicella aurantiaca]|uniref:Fasciclin domain-containing protein n=1 Tax=Arcicella aurantiaca TaxID=591202 RepID=A0A316DIX0_9BACT|nr:fasciclin domain-containing protein [Arcicella aurantiaca]PWK18121.1 fasciclin domain-containing protein [Arcicella aurantiaca]
MRHQYPMRTFFILFVAFSSLVSCTREELDIYARPEGLEPPIYQQLQAKKNFNTLLQVIDKSGYQRTLSSAGYWTMFAPNDEAFTKYLQKNNLTVGTIDSTKARELIQYLLVYNAFDKDRLDDYQSTIGWVPSKAFRRRTAYYTGFYTDQTFDGASVKAVASNRNSTFYSTADNNNKYLSYFTDNYFADKGLTAADYNYFYPSVPYTGFNVMDSKVVTKDIVAENGMIHEVDNVFTAQPSIEEYLRNKPEYSEFKKILEKYAVNFIPNAEATKKYQILTGKSDQVYIKSYSKQALTFWPNNENFTKFADNDGQQEAWSIFVPTNETLQPYLKNVILENYASLDVVPSSIIADLLNAHLWSSGVWPSKFKSSFNGFGEEARFDPVANVVEKKILSNGFFYGTNKVQETNVFSTVYAKAYLDPKYSIMTRLLNLDLRPTILNPKFNYTVFMMSDDAFKTAGYDYDGAKNEWGYTAPGTTTRTVGDINRNNLLRIVATSVIPTPNNELDNLNKDGIIDASNGEYIKYSQNKVYSAGLADISKTLTILGSKSASNGKVYYTDGLLNFTALNIGKHIETLGTATTSPFNFFWQFLKNSANAYNATTGEITGTASGSFYTVFVPDNAAIQAAVNAGVLPGTGTGAVKTPNFNPTTNDDKLKVLNFISYHVLNKKSLIPDGKESGSMETLLKDNTGDGIRVTVINSVGAMQVTDRNSRKSVVNVAKSNNLSNRAVIHLVDNYLQP